MPEEKQTGPDDRGIPPGWDFPEAREAAEAGADLWALAAAQRMTPWERIQAACAAARRAAGLDESGSKRDGV